MNSSGPDPKDAVELISFLSAHGLDNDSFCRLHHLRGKMEGFSKYCARIHYFQEDGNNFRVFQRLLRVKARCNQGSPPSGETFASLAEEAFRTIPPVPF